MYNKRYITLFDVIPIYNDDVSNFNTGRLINTDLTEDGHSRLADLTLCYNNFASFIDVFGYKLII